MSANEKFDAEQNDSHLSSKLILSTDVSHDNSLTANKMLA